MRIASSSIRKKRRRSLSSLPTNGRARAAAAFPRGRRRHRYLRQRALRIYVERQGNLEKTSACFREPSISNTAQRIASAIGRRIDKSSPMVDAGLLMVAALISYYRLWSSTGERFQSANFPGRRLPLRRWSGRRTVSRDRSISGDRHERAAKFVISGGTGQAKPRCSTRCPAISTLVSDHHHRRCVELYLQQPHVVQMETRPANVEGVGQVGQRELVRNALRIGRTE